MAPKKHKPVRTPVREPKRKRKKRPPPGKPKRRQKPLPRRANPLPREERLSADDRPFGVKSRSRTARVTGVDPEDDHPRRAYLALRYSAAVDYVTSVKDISIRELWTWPKYQHLALETLHRWSTEDNWWERRLKFMKEVQAEAEAKLHGGLVKARVQQMRRMEEIAQSMEDDILGQRVSPKSKEGMASALVRVLDSAEQLRDKISDQVQPSYVGQNQRDGGVTAEVSEEEARAAATAIMAQRRERIRAQLREARGEDESDE